MKNNMLQNWKTYKLEEVLHIKNGKTKPKEFGNIPIYGGNGILGYGNKANLDSEVVLIGRVGAYCGAVYYENREIWVSDNSLFGIAKENFDSKYLFYLLKWADLNRFATGSSQPLLTLGALNVLEYNIPSYSEQKAIASILSALDDKIELNLQMNKTLEEMAMALYKHWFVDFGPFQDGEFVDSELGKIPKGWEVKIMDDVVELIIDHRGKTPKKMGGDWSKDSYKCFEAISAKNIKKGKIVKPETIKFIGSDLYQKWMKDPLRDKDVLLTSEAPIGEYYFVLNKTAYCLSQRLFGIRSNPEILEPELLYCFISSSSGQQQLLGRGSGSTVQGIKQSELRKLQLIIPDKGFQTKISNQLNGYYSQLRNNDNENQTLTKLRDTLLPKLISGEVRVKDVEQQIAKAI